jgi:hypothetical protein
MSKGQWTITTGEHKEYIIQEECSDKVLGIFKDEDSAKLGVVAPELFDALHEALLLLQDRESDANIFIDKAYNILYKVEED